MNKNFRERREDVDGRRVRRSVDDTVDGYRGVVRHRVERDGWCERVYHHSGDHNWCPPFRETDDAS